jgi:hypothetical protein
MARDELATSQAVEQVGIARTGERGGFEEWQRSIVMPGLDEVVGFEDELS